jgi:hypothetical protein
MPEGIGPFVVLLPYLVLLAGLVLMPTAVIPSIGEDD